MASQLDVFYMQLDKQYQTGDSSTVEKFLQHTIDATAKNEGDVPLLFAAYNELGSFYRGISQFSQSLEAFEKGRNLIVLHMGTQCGEYASVLNNMAGTLRLMGDYATAIELFLQAVQVYRQAGLEKNYAFASVLNNLSLAYRETKQIDQAITYLEQALKLMKQMPQHQQELAITYNNLSQLYCAAGKRKQAEICLRYALVAYDQCPPEERIHYAAVLNSLAAVFYEDGEYTQALQLYEQSIDYTKQFFGKNLEYGMTLQNMRWVYEQLGQQDKAVSALQEALGIYVQCLGASHERTCAIRDNLRRLQMCVLK